MTDENIIPANLNWLPALSFRNDYRKPLRLIFRDYANKLVTWKLGQSSLLFQNAAPSKHPTELYYAEKDDALYIASKYRDVNFDRAHYAESKAEILNPAAIRLESGMTLEKLWVLARQIDTEENRTVNCTLDQLPVIVASLRQKAFADIKQISEICDRECVRIEGMIAMPAGAFVPTPR